MSDMSMKIMTQLFYDHTGLILILIVLYVLYTFNLGCCIIQVQAYMQALMDYNNMSFEKACVCSYDYYRKHLFPWHKPIKNTIVWVANKIKRRKKPT